MVKRPQAGRRARVEDKTHTSAPLTFLMRKNRRLFIFVDPYQPTGTYGGKITLEIRKWAAEGWRVQLLIPKHIRTASKRFPKEGYLLMKYGPAKVSRETAYKVCSKTRE